MVVEWIDAYETHQLRHALFLYVAPLRQHVIETLRRYVWPIREWSYVPIVPGPVRRADVQHRRSPDRGLDGWVDPARCGKYVRSSASQ